MKKNVNLSKPTNTEVAKEIAGNLKTMRKPCDEKTPMLKRCLAGGFTLAYTCGVLTSTFAGCTTSDNITDHKNAGTEIIEDTNQSSTTQNESEYQYNFQSESETTNNNYTLENSTRKDETMKQENNSLLSAKELPDIYFNKAERAAASVKAQLGEEAYQNVIDNLGDASGTSSQGSYVANLIDSINSSNGVDATTRVMRACGYQCIEPGILTNAKKLYQESADMEEFLQKLSISLGGSNLNLKDNKIIAIYDTCYCNIHDTDNKLNGCYCQCSCGWYEKLFATVLDAPVNVELVKSIKADADHCEFEITY